MKNSETGEKYYVGSSIDLRCRENYHRNPNSPNHAAFGKYIHKEGLVDKVVMVVLEPLKHDDREELKKLCRRQEFVWKKKIPCKFCDVYDGLSLQAEDVQREHKLEIREKSRDHRNALAREHYKKYFTPERKLHKNKLSRASHAKRRLLQDGVVIKSRQMGLTREEKLAKRRARYAAKKLAEGKKIKPRGRVQKPKRKTSVNSKKEEPTMENENCKSEEWKPIPGFKDAFASNLGRIKSIHGKSGKEYIRCNKTNRPNTLGYYNIIVNKQRSLIHRLVWMAFRGAIPKGFEVDHIDRDPSNNKLSNLRLLTHKENTANSIKKTNTGVFGVSKDERCRKKPFSVNWRENGNKKQTYFATIQEAELFALRTRRRVWGDVMPIVLQERLKQLESGSLHLCDGCKSLEKWFKPI